MNASQAAVHELNLLLEEAELLATLNWEMLIKYLAQTNDSATIRERRIAHVTKLRVHSDRLIAFRQRFPQSMLEAIAEISHVLAKDKTLKGATLTVGYTDDKFSPSYPYKINLYYI